MHESACIIFCISLAHIYTKIDQLTARIIKMYHLIKDISNSTGNYNELLEIFLDNDSHDLVHEILRTKHPHIFYPKKKYSSKITVSLISNYCDVKLSESVILEDYLAVADIRSMCFINMIRYHNFTEESEVRAKKMLHNIKQDDIVYLAPDNSCYAKPFIAIESDNRIRYIPLAAARSDTISEIAMKHYEDLQYETFADDIEVDDHCFYYVSKGYRMNTNIIDGAYVLILGNNYEDYKFLSDMAQITDCAIYVMALEKDMPRLKQLFPKAACKPLDKPITKVEIQEYERSCYSYSGNDVFTGRRIISCESLNEFLACNIYNIGSNSSGEESRDHVDNYRRLFEKKMILIKAIYDGQTIWTEDNAMIFRPYAGVYKMINRLKFKTYIESAYRDITVICTQ